MSGTVPWTPLAKRYKKLATLSHAQRSEEARKLTESPERLIADFNRSIDEAASFFDSQDFADVALSGEDSRSALDREPGLTSTPSLCRWLEDNRRKDWNVLGATDARLTFHYLDYELVSTRAPGERLEGKRSTKDGPRLDLLLARAETRTPIIGEVKLTVKRKGKGRGAGEWKPDKDPFYALIQALASASYLLPKSQFSRLKRHDRDDRLATDQPRFAIYLMIGREPEAARHWFDLRDYAERLSALILPELSDRIELIAGIDLGWFPHRPPGTRLRLTKRFAHHAI